MKKFLEDFKSFAMKGNIIDLAVGVVIGGAFGKIVTSLVNDILMPLLSLISGKFDLSKVEYTFKGTDVVIKYGPFLQNVIDFLLISMSIFIVIKVLARFKRKQEKIEEAKEEQLSKEAELLAEIRDLIKTKE